MNPPSYIAAAGVIGAPITYKWDSNLGLKFYAGQENVRLYTAIDAAHFKAKMACGIAITEWIVWRYQGLSDLTDPLHRIEAAWAAVINPVYTKSLLFSLTPAVHEKGTPVEGPLELSLSALGIAHARYSSGSIYLAEPVMKQAALARHVIPGKKVFDDWLANALRQAASVFPRGVDYDEETGTYDASHEDPVPREFFDPAFSYSEAAAEQALRDFLLTLDPAMNRYLNTPEEMKAAGFQGTPYSL